MIAIAFTALLLVLAAFTASAQGRAGSARSFKLATKAKTHRGRHKRHHRRKHGRRHVAASHRSARASRRAPKDRGRKTRASNESNSPVPAPAPTPAPEQEAETNQGPEPAPGSETQEPTPVPAPEEPTPMPAPEAQEPSPAPESEAQVPTPSPDPAPLFAGGFDSKTFNEWLLLQSLSGRTTIVSDSPLQGSGNARFEVRQGDVEPQTGSQRAEVTGPTFTEGADIYIRDAVRVPATNSSEGPWLIVQQLHDYDATYNGSPGMAVFLDSGPELRIGPGNGSHTFWRSGKLEVGRWYELVYHVKLSHDAGAGFVEVWLNGTQQKLSNGAAREYGKTMIAAQTYLKAGIYRSAYSTGTAVVEHDAVAIGDSLASVE